MNLRVIKFVYEDILLLFDKFGYNEFIYRDMDKNYIKHSLKRLTNDNLIIKYNKHNGRIHYKLNKYIIDLCLKYKIKEDT